MGRANAMRSGVFAHDQRIYVSFVASEIIHTIVGSLGLVATAPLSAFAAGKLLAYPEQAARTEPDTIKEESGGTTKSAARRNFFARTFF